MVGSAPAIVVAPDSFKESLTAAEVCQAITRGLTSVLPEAVVTAVPMADGGEGTMQSLVDASGGSIEHLEVTGPIGDPVLASYGLLADGTTAVIEMASASGLGLVPPHRRDPRVATTRGTGELVLACLDRGVRHLVLGIGGSATNDGGAGFATALGVRLLDTAGEDLPAGGAALARLATIDASGLDPRLAELTIEVACDVDNPLTGPRGASAVYGPQKGADAEAVADLDASLAHYAEIIADQVGREVSAIPGAGAAGGLGAGLLAFTGATLRSGVSIVIDNTGLAHAVNGADLVITGEGRIDGQTRFGKTPWGVAQVARAAGVPVVAIAGGLGDGLDELGDTFAAILPVVRGPGTLADALSEAAPNLERTAAAVARLLRLGADLP